ncbi:ribonuclease HI [Aestuariispira insulae]|uniref:Ribonuclease H n=1 Tax=Aestuariispira insulae TaxID=1461337 RepID=A0A3D9HVK0_9PROT|nr:ribonuclease HI [Aestuariispira insulae]RED53487.1 ribonuclease HI [Aestuariispira insulae]
MSNTHEIPTVIYIDGACRGNPGPGGWGVFLTRGSNTKVMHGGDPDTTNNRMEMTAAIKALESLKQGNHPRTIVTDSAYLRNGITKHIIKWKENGWRGSNKKPVKNQDLWMRLDELVQIHQVDWKWVKGHSGNPGNERSDALAHKGLLSILD